MKPEKLDEIASHYGYELQSVTKLGGRIYRNPSDGDRTVTLNPRDVTLEEHSRGDGFRDWLERKFV